MDFWTTEKENGFCGGNEDAEATYFLIPAICFTTSISDSLASSDWDFINMTVAATELVESPLVSTATKAAADDRHGFRIIGNHLTFY